MNFYDFHIGDYASRTAHLEPMEDLAYRRLLDLYYVREAALPLDTQELARLIRLRGQEAVIKAVLAEFFTLTDNEDGWAHDRCEAVIAAAVIKRTKAKASADQRWANERSANAMPTHSDRSTKAQRADCEGNAPSPSPSPINNPPTPRKRGSSFDPKAMEIPGWLAPAVWFEWCDDRAERKKPITERAAKKQFAQLLEYDRQGFSAESVVAHSIAGGFQGLYPPPKGRQSAADVARQNVPGPTAYTPTKALSAAELAANRAKADQVAASLGIPNMKVKH